ncbi:diguanylate cyclase [Nitratidesulfovibrio liaohensis]|uniref:diguanylate cyclase n=1 Tax=Nitratidesulfovibrio liaohensis TaxID=2604158 RepID=A0ABY9R7D7_9BACT|nr:diguanylate cyclase [Nitratidesulfovibrio liaohensis]WMW66614.1 diguanylate cyclase [Nitratidesulfovibrio liaohensis]
MRLGRTIKAQLRFYSLLLILLPLALSLAAFYGVLRTEGLRKAQGEMQAELRHHRFDVERWLGYRLADVVHVSRTDAVRAVDIPAMKRDFHAFLDAHGDFRSLVYVDAAGRTVLDLDMPEGGVDLSDREYFLRARQGQPFISRVLTGRTSGKAIVIFSSPVLNPQGDFAGLVFGAVRIDALLEMVSSLRRTPVDPSFLVDAASGVPLLAPENTPSIPLPSRDAPIDGPTVYRNRDGDEVLGVGLPLKNGEWLLVQERAVADILGDMHRQLLLLLAVSGLTIAALTPFLLRLAQRVTGPIERISAMSERIMAGEYGSVCPGLDAAGMPPELERLYRNFCRMAERIGTHVGELERLTGTDELTGLANRRLLADAGARIVSICRRAGQPCACLMLDLDHFKHINDVHGHATGDEVLRRLAAAIASTVRSSDFAVRMGGEEFAIIAPNTDAPHAMALAERLRRTVERIDLRQAGMPVPVAISVGVAGMTVTPRYGAGPLEDLLAGADHALYRAKQAGRNRVMLWDDADHGVVAEQDAPDGEGRPEGAPRLRGPLSGS